MKGGKEKEGGRELEGVKEQNGTGFWKHKLRHVLFRHRSRELLTHYVPYQTLDYFKTVSVSLLLRKNL